MWIEIAGWIEKIPATFWGVLAGSFFTLLGIYFTNKAQANRLTEQLRHDRDIKKRDREHGLRRDIYLAVAEALQIGLNTIWRYANTDIANAQISERYEQHAPALAKIHAVATVPTATAITSLSGEIAGAMSRLSLLRIEAVGAKAAVAMRLEQMNKCQADSDRWLEEIRQYNLAGRTDPRQWEALQRNFKFVQDEWAKARTKHAEATNVFSLLSMQLLQAAGNESAAVQKLIKPVVIAVRKELDIEIDEVGYGALMDKTTATAAERMNTYLEKIAKFVESKRILPSDTPPAEKKNGD